MDADGNGSMQPGTPQRGTMLATVKKGRTNSEVVKELGKLAVSIKQAMNAVEGLQELGENKVGPVVNGYCPSWEEHLYDLRGWYYQLQKIDDLLDCDFSLEVKPALAEAGLAD